MCAVDRRKFLTALSGIPLIQSPAAPAVISSGKQRFKISLNAYSFNALLIAKKISHRELLDFCSKTGFDAIDMTGYYFSGYPATPTDHEIFSFKRYAHEVGLNISGTGVRNEFGIEKGAELDKEIDLVLRWIEIAAKLGAPVLRVYTSKTYTTGEERKQVTDRILYAMNACLQKAATYGVILGIQNHNDFLRTSNECQELIDALNSKWVGLVLDTGNFVAPDPYGEIQKAIPLAVNWQLKEKLLVNGIQTPMDLDKLIGIIAASNYKGTIPIETLGMTDPVRDVPLFFEKVRRLLIP